MSELKNNSDDTPSVLKDLLELPPNSPTDALAGESVPIGDTQTVFAAILFTDIVESVRLERELGTKAYAAVLRRHGELFDEALGTPFSGTVEKNTGDGFMVRFRSPSDAVTAALRFQWYLRREPWKTPRPLRVRIGIHEGEIMLINSHQMPSAVGTPVNLAARVQSLAQGGQVLMTRGVFDNARQFLRTIPNVPASEQGELGWQAHGTYLLKGIDEPVEIFEAGEQGRVPFTSPESGDTARRSVSAEEEATLGWRPAKAREVPKRHGWYLQERVGEGGFGEVWLAQNRQTSEQRVFKFCFDVVRLRSFKRELLLFRMIREALGPRRDIVTLYEVQIESPPFFLESEYCSGGTLKQWFQTKIATGEVPMGERLDIIARVARALAAAHSLGIIHKDVKPSNIFMEELEGGICRPRLADFGIGVLIDRQLAAELHLTMSGALTAASDPSRTGTRMYSAPEYMINRPASVQGDLYSLGVLLFQILVGDFDRPLGPGWQRDIEDPLLVEDIAMCVDVDPQRRFSSALQLAERVDSLEERRSEVQAAEAAARQAEEQQRQLEVFRRRVRLGAIGSAVAIALIGALTALVIVLDQSRKNALQHAADLKVQRELAEDRAYVADMQTATDDVAERRGEMTREIIERYRHKPGERERRGWEWFFVDSVLNTPSLARTVSKAPLRALALSPDEKHVAVGGDDGEVSLWSTATLEKVAAWRPAQEGIRSLSWQSSGRLAIGLASGEVSVHSSPLTSTEAARWQAHQGPVTSLDWHPRRDELASGGADGRLAVWNPSGGLLDDARKEAPIHALDWQPEGFELAALYGQPLNLVVASPEGIEDGEPIPLKISESPLVWRPGGVEVAIAMEDVPMRSWNPRTGGDSFSVRDFFSAGGTAYAWSPTGEGLAIGGVDGKILVVDVPQLAESRVALYGHKGPVTGLHWLMKDGERLISAGQDGTLRAWRDLWKAQQIVQLSAPDILADAQWHPLENKLARLVAGDEVQIVRSDSGETEESWLMPPPLQPDAPYRGGRLAWSPDAKLLAAVCPGRPVAVWNAEEKTVRILPGTGDERDVQWMPDSRRLLLRGETGWSCYAVDDQKFTGIAGTENVLWMGGIEGEQVAVVSRVDGALRFSRRDLDGGTMHLDVALPAELGSIRCGAFNGARSMLALGGETGAVAWVDTRTGAVVRPAITHAGPVGALGWHPDGTRLATVGADAVCRIFNIDQAAQTWVIAHKLQSGVVSAGWNADGRRLLLGSAPKGLIRIYDASLSMDLARGVPAKPTPAPPSPTTQACAAIARAPDEEEGWTALAQQIRSKEEPQASSLLAALELAAQGRFSSDREPSPAGEVVESWEGVPLPTAAQVVQACLLRRWEDVLKLCGEPREPWFHLARAEALLQLGHREAGEAANLSAWQALRRQHGGEDNAPTTSGTLARANGTVDLSAWANIKLTESWSGGDNNSLSSLPAVVPQPDGFEFLCGDFLQLASRNFRITGARMLPRSTAWIRFPGPTQRVAAMIGATRLDPQDNMEDMVIGSVFLLRSSGRGAVRIPLVYGRNIWDWWAPAVGNVVDPPPEKVAWRGENQLSSENGRTTIITRLTWETPPQEDPVTAIAFVSHMRKPAPFVVAVHARPRTTPLHLEHVEKR